MFTDTKHSTFWKSIEYLFCLFFITFPFLNYTSFLYGGTSTRSLNLVIFSAVLGIAFGVWALQKSNSVSLVKSPLFLILGLYLASLTVSGLLGIDSSTTFWSVATRMTGVWYFISLGVFMLLLWAIINDEKTHHRLMLSILLSTALYSVLDLFSADGLGFIFASYPHDAFTFGNSTFAAMYLFGAFLLALYYLYQSQAKQWWMYLLPVVLLINPNITNTRVWSGDFSAGLMGEARATGYVIVLSLFALLGIWIVSKIKDLQTRSRVSYTLFGMSVLAVSFALFSLLSPQGYLHEAYLSEATAARPLVWEMSGKAIEQQPFFGWGADNFERVFEKNYDNRLLQDEYGNEAWFDRAHNVVIDQLVDNGVVGTALYFLVYLVTLAALLYTMLNAPVARDQALAAILTVYFSLHIAELQTAFDTSISYPMVAFMFVSAAALFHRTLARGKHDMLIRLSQPAMYGAGAVLIAFCSWSLLVGALPLTKAQMANWSIRTVGSAEKRMPYYPTLFASSIDVHAFIWRTSTDFQRGIAENPKVLEDSQRVEGLMKEAVLFEQGYRDYIRENPSNFRAHLNLADILIYQMLFGVNKLEEAQTVLDQAILLVPQSPQSYWMKAVAYVYMRKFELAREYAKKGLALNPQIKQSQAIVKYVEDSIKTFPEIDLFFFRQI